MSMSKIKVGDTVRVITGKDKGREGKVLSIDHAKGRLTVEGVNLITKHAKQNQQNPNGGIIHKEGTVDMSNVMLVLNGNPVRVGFEEIEVEKKDGKKKKKRIRVVRTADGTVRVD